MLIFFYPDSLAQNVTLEYIFQDTNIINPRPALKFINSKFNKIYYYADDDYDGKLSLFDHNYLTGETYKYSDTGETASEFVILPEGNALSIIKGDLYISKDFVNTRAFSKDLQITNSDKYEYSPEVIDNAVIYRHSGNYYITRFFLNDINDTPKVSNELQLTSDESDSVSYQLLAIKKPELDFDELSKTFLRILFARYDNSSKQELIFPDYMTEFVKGERKKRGISKVKLFEYELRVKGTDSIYKFINEIKYPDSIRYCTVYADYSPRTKYIILDAESLDRHNRKLYYYNTWDKTINEIYSESDSAWYERHGNTTSFINDSVIIFESEVSGYNNLYSIKADGTGFQKIAGDNYTTLESVIDRKTGKIYFSANREKPYEYFIYETDFDGIILKQITSESGDVEDLRISAEGSYLFYSQSFINKPNELRILSLQDYSSRQITNAVSPEFSQVDWNIPELITFPNEEDGQLVYAFLYKPKDYNPKKKYPLICFAHGAGYLQNVTYGFSPYRDNFMVNTFLTGEGFVILDIDFRGSRGYGKEFRNKTYRNLGYWEVSDYISGINYLSSQGITNSEKIGIYGGSYGGFITLMALFRHPEIFKCGVALRAVSNWKNYFYSNWWYTLARLGDYNKDEIKQYYDISSPITYAENLQGQLLMTHGMLDDNVFFQDMVQLTQKLIDNKKDFEVMFYPKENHSFYRQTSWLDQYKRIWKFFEKNLKNE
ncbi:MAG: prolyl oligopeptidase family serine peptidase [Chlorobi bacterium]|nr:prolyl oligopeptidase family serine peptidase [Chlorobiota bacterium]MCI0716718.1 prolyl oligopeptidase family serine peptidase [Chlorobiota bacterium]